MMVDSLFHLKPQQHCWDWWDLSVWLCCQVSCMHAACKRRLASVGRGEKVSVTCIMHVWWFYLRLLRATCWLVVSGDCWWRRFIISVSCFLERDKRCCLFLGTGCGTERRHVPLPSCCWIWNKPLLASYCASVSWLPAFFILFFPGFKKNNINIFCILPIISLDLWWGLKLGYVLFILKPQFSSSDNIAVPPAYFISWFEDHQNLSQLPLQHPYLLFALLISWTTTSTPCIHYAPMKREYIFAVMFVVSQSFSHKRLTWTPCCSESTVDKLGPLWTVASYLLC